MTRADDIRASAEFIFDAWPQKCGCSEEGPCHPCELRIAKANKLREHADTIEMVENNLRHWGENSRKKGLVEMADALKGETK